MSDNKTEIANCKKEKGKYFSYKKKILLLLLVTGVLLLAACGNNSSDLLSTSGDSASTEKASTGDASDAEDTGGLQTVRFGSPNSYGRPLFELLSVGLDQGFLEKELNNVGYTGEYTPIDQAGPAINEAFAAGELDVAVYGDFPAVAAKSNGLDTKVIGVANAVQHQAVFVRDDAGIESVADLEGKNIAVGIGTNFQFYWKKLVKGEGLDESKINLINSMDNTTLLTTGDIDAAVALITTATYYEEQGLGHILVNSAEHPEWTTEFLVVASTPFIEAHPEVGVAINKALIRSKEYIDENVDALYESSANDALSADLVKNAYTSVTIEGYDPAQLLEVTPEKLQTVADMMYQEGLIAGELDTSSWLDTSYYEQAKDELQ